jgi:hypothetical protein
MNDVSNVNRNFINKDERTNTAAEKRNKSNNNFKDNGPVVSIGSSF